MMISGSNTCPALLSNELADIDLHILKASGEFRIPGLIVPKRNGKPNAWYKA